MKSAPFVARHYDLWLISAAFLALTCEVSLLFHQLRLVTLPFLNEQRQTKGSEVGRLVRKNRSVQIRSEKSLTWYPLQSGEPIVFGDTVLTGEQANAEIQMPEGGGMSLDAFTLVRFRMEKKAEELRLALEVNRGRLHISSQETEVKLRLGTRWVALQPKAKLVIAGEPHSTQMQVEQGQATVESESTVPVVLNAGESIHLNEKASLIQRSLVLKNAVPKPGALEFFDGKNALVGFAWEGPAESLEWDTSAEMAHPNRVELQRPQIRLPFEKGKYYWRVATSQGKSAVMDFGVLPRAHYTLPREISSLKPKEGHSFEISWRRVPEATSYRVQWSSDPGFSRIEKEWETPVALLKIAGVRKGKYYWRVQARHELGDWPFSEGFEVRVKGKMQPPKPKGVKELPAPKPIRRSAVGSWGRLWAFVLALLEPESRAETGKVVFEFSWEPTSGAKAYRLEISQTESFKKVSLSKEISETAVVLELEDREKYFWRVAAIDEDGDLGRFSETQTIRRALIPLAPLPKKRVETAIPIPKKEIDPPRPRFWTLWAGWGGSFITQRLVTNSYSMTQTGLPPGRLVAGFQYDLPVTSIRVQGGFQSLRYKSEGSQSDFSFPQLSAEGFFLRLFGSKDWPLDVGARLKTEASLTSVSNTVSFQMIPVASLALGTHRQWNEVWQMGLGVEVAPLGVRQGAAVWVQNRVTPHWEWAGLRPAMELTLNPFYRWQTLGTEWNFEASLNLIVEFLNPVEVSVGKQ